MALSEKIDVKILEFPNLVTDTRPQWRQEVSARLRDFQMRRENRDIAPQLPRSRNEQREPPVIVVVEDVAPGVVSLTQRRELDVRVVRALQRIERARANMPATVFQHQETKVSLKIALTEEEIALAPEVDDAKPTIPPTNPRSLKAVEAETGQAIPSRSAKYQQSSVLPQPSNVKVEPLKEDTAPGLNLSWQPPVQRQFIPAPETNTNLLKQTIDREPIAGQTQSESGPQAEQEEIAGISQPRAVKARLVCSEVIDDAYLERKEAARAAAIQEKRRQLALAQGLYDDYAPAWVRAVATLIDWGIAFAASLPLILISGFTASSWRWVDMTLLTVVSMIFFMALYSTLITYYSGRTWGQELLFLCVAQVENGEPPSFRQCVLRALLFISAPLTLGISLLYALWDAEGRTLHDKFSGTIVLRS